MCQQHKFQRERRISKWFIRTQKNSVFLRITPTALEEYSPVLIELNKETNKQTKKTPGRDTYNRSHLRPLMGKRFSPIWTFFPLVSSRAFRDAPHSRFTSKDPNQCLPNFLNMLLLALPQIYTCVFHLWKSIDFGRCYGWRFSPISTFFSLVSSRAFRDAPNSRFRCGDLNQCLLNFLKMLLLALFQIFTRVFHLWKSVALDNAWVKVSRPFISFFHSRVFARLAMRHTRVFCVKIPNYAYGALQKC